jgi:hypothetical protein
MVAISRGLEPLFLTPNLRVAFYLQVISKMNLSPRAQWREPPGRGLSEGTVAERPLRGDKAYTTP